MRSFNPSFIMDQFDISAEYPKLSGKGNSGSYARANQCSGFLGAIAYGSFTSCSSFWQSHTVRGSHYLVQQKFTRLANMFFWQYLYVFWLFHFIPPDRRIFSNQ
jgi:hypothetical protein